MADFNPFNWNWSQFKAAGRNIASYTAGIITMLAATHFIDQGTAADLNTNIGLITDGLTKIATGIAGLSAILLPIYTSWRAAHSASPTQQATSLTNAVPGTQIITSPEIAAATPNNPNIVANTTNKVVSQ